MIAVSSFRPLADCTDVIRFNQFTAKASWDRAFREVVYLNEAEPEMNGSRTRFVSGLTFPLIRDLIAQCSFQSGWSCIINADILVRPDIFKRIERELVKQEALSAISRRWQFDPDESVRNVALVDLGLDIFCAVQDVWNQALEVVPDQFRIGHCLWDTWMLGFLNVTSQGRWFDFTPSKCILHPQHEDRQHPYHIDSSFRDVYLENVNFPKRKLT